MFALIFTKGLPLAGSGVYVLYGQGKENHCLCLQVNLALK